jgi:hypothetical protein
MAGHKDIPDEVVKRAQLYDYEHQRADRAEHGRRGSWGSVPADRVRRLLWGAYGGERALVVARDEFLAASVAVWREIGRLDSRPEGYHPIAMDVELRKRERAAWERYRDLLDARPDEPGPSPRVSSAPRI